MNMEKVNITENLFYLYQIENKLTKRKKYLIHAFEGFVVRKTKKEVFLIRCRMNPYQKNVIGYIFSITKHTTHCNDNCTIFVCKLKN